MLSKITFLLLSTLIVVQSYKLKEVRKPKITENRLAELRSSLLYPFNDTGSSNGLGDYQKDLHSSTSQINKNLNFTFPFFGISYNYIRVSMNGFLEFSDPPPHYTYPLVFPIKEWPAKNDPAFIGIFHSKCRIGDVSLRDKDKRMPGVYFSVFNDLDKSFDTKEIELRERLLADLHEGIIGATDFQPKHAIIVTWKNMSFAGGLDNTLRRTNTFQAVLTTDEDRTYVIFNYADINWSTHTEAGGDTVKGEGGTQAFVGFNAGNGSRSFEYTPFSQSERIFDLTQRGFGNNFKGRHIFRVDEEILQGACNENDASDPPLYIAPTSGNMLGGTIVNVTGPCFDEKITSVRCIFGSYEVTGVIVDKNRAICVQPFLKRQGYIDLNVRVNNDDRKTWHGKYFVEPPNSVEAEIWFKTTDVYSKTLISLPIGWKKEKLSRNDKESVQILLFGYREVTHEIVQIEKLTTTLNSGEHVFNSQDFKNNQNDDFLDIEVGIIAINLTFPPKINGISISNTLWSHPIPLAWYFGSQWRSKYGNLWPEALCDNWIEREMKMKDFANTIPVCPCTLDHILNDKGRFLPDLSTNMSENCFKSAFLSSSNAEQQCCYDEEKFLMLSNDKIDASRPKRRHNNAFVPSLSQFYHDEAPFYACCLWQTEYSRSCEQFRMEMRISQDCVGYQSPAIASVFGDPHFITFDGLEYTFNGIGEFVLVRSKYVDVQGRFEQMPRGVMGDVKSSFLSSIVVKGNNSLVIEIRLRPKSSLKYRLDVFLNGKRTFFDNHGMKQQFFKGIVVYTPLEITNQSKIIVMMDSGIGLEVQENHGMMSARVFAPWNFINSTFGLFGTFNFDPDDDLTLPNSKILNVNTNNFAIVHREFGLKWLLSDKFQEGIGKSLFLREYGRTSDFYTNDLFRPNFIKEPSEFLPSNMSEHVKIAAKICDESYQCRYDYGMTFDEKVANNTKIWYEKTLKSKEINGKRVISCGILDTPRYGFKSNFSFVNGTKVEFSCHEGFIISGDPTRTCNDEGRWTEEIYGFTTCIRLEEQIARTTGISLAIILFIIVPLSLLAIIFLKQHFKALQEKQEILEEENRWKEIESLRLKQRELIESASKEQEIELKDIETEEKIKDEEKKLIETPL
ncbi:protein mesh-like [Culicoides brevitarsis]|uniref:protein mesh-like n=1 Tax=Culicoides brevitarsis TaxID=469753 RepID=UPI00307BA7C6